MEETMKYVFDIYAYFDTSGQSYKALYARKFRL